MDTLSSLATRLVEPARWVVIMGIAATLALNVLFFVSPPESAVTTRGADRGTEKIPDRSSTVSINAILKRNLFGEAGQSTAEAANDLPTVETRLPLELLGVFVAEVVAESAAIVAQKGKAGELYTVGQTLPGNAELIEVHADHIILRRAGSRETLRFPTTTASPVVSATAPSRSASSGRISPRTSEDVDDDTDGGSRSEAAPWTRGMPTPRDFVDAYQERIDEDPEGALSDLGLSPVAAGSAEGYKLDAATANSPYLSQTGLQPGDVILSVNGQAVGNIQQDRQRIDNILAQGSARLEVQRGSRRFFVSASLR